MFANYLLNLFAIFLPYSIVLIAFILYYVVASSGFTSKKRFHIGPECCIVIFFKSILLK